MKLFRTYIFLLLGILAISPESIEARGIQSCACVKTRSFSDVWSICSALYEHILEILPGGSTMVELGSGWGSGELSKHFTVWSVEHDEKWIGKYDTNYIHAPIIDGWYDVSTLKNQLPSSYDLLLVDGPPGKIGRGKFLEHLELFNTDITIIFDDVNRPAEHKLMEEVSKKLGREFYVRQCGNKKFGVIARSASLQKK